MIHEKTAYELSQSQVETPPPVISLFWRLTHSRRNRFDRVLDVGAGDCRFAIGGKYRQYVGLEIDAARVKSANVPERGRLIRGCAFEHRDREYDACIGNPPYVRHHDIEDPWKVRIARQIKNRLGIHLNQKCNLFLYFVCLGLAKTNDKGLVAFVIPYEWVSRPSAEPVRALIRAKRWDVNVYRFTKRVFPGVETTASISVIDKSGNSGCWTYFDILSDYSIVTRGGPVADAEGVLDYADRGEFWAMRGLSPGSQQVFCLTEDERLQFRLRQCDVSPCVTTLRNLPRHVKTLTKSAFRHHFVQPGQRCWLISSHASRLSTRLQNYLSKVPVELRDNHTCNKQLPWYNYNPHPVPKLLVATGFTTFGPKVLVNSVGAHAVGSVAGIHAHGSIPLRRLQRYLLSIDFERILVPHAKTLKKIEMRQFNAVLNVFAVQR